MGLHAPDARRASAPDALAALRGASTLTAAVQPYIEHLVKDGYTEQAWTSRAWDFYETPEVRFAARQYANAFASAKLVLGRRTTPWRDPEPVLEPTSKAEHKAYELLQTFAGGPEGQVELLDRMGTYFMVPGDMVLVGAYDPAHIADNKFAKWDVWSTSEVRWTGTNVQIQTSSQIDVWQDMPDYIKHIRIWNRHPRRGWESDSPVRAALGILDLIGLYDQRLGAEAVSRLIGAGVWMIPQGMKLPSATGDPSGGTPNDFLRLLMDVASMAIKDPRSAAAMVPILIEAAPDDILAAKEGFMSFSTSFDERIGELQEAAIRRWSVGVDLPAEVVLGLAEATHWNASLISEDKVQSFIIPSLRRGVGNLTTGWLRPALQEFRLNDPALVVWFDPSGIKTRVDTVDESQWARDRHLITDDEVLYASGLSQAERPEGEELKRQLLIHMAKELPESVPDVLRELGIETSVPGIAEAGLKPKPFEKTVGTDEQPSGNGRQGPQLANAMDKTPSNSRPGRAATLSTRRS